MGPHDFFGSRGAPFSFGSRAQPETLSTLTRMQIRNLRPEDWPDVARIFAEGIATGDATFETEVPSWAAWVDAHLAGHRFVVTLDGDVGGWAALAPVSSRDCYAGVAEHSIYIAESVRGLGFGRQLLAALIASAEGDGFWTLQSGIFPENEASISLHTALGFRIVGVRERLGRLPGAWRDVLLLERRSAVDQSRTSKQWSSAAG